MTQSLNKKQTLIEFTLYYEPVHTLDKIGRITGWCGTYKYNCTNCLEEYYRLPHFQNFCNTCLKQKYKEYLND